MAQRHPVILRLILVVVICFLLAWASLFILTLRARYQSQSLLVAVRSMKVGAATLAEVQPVLARYPVTNDSPSDFSGQCRSADAGYSISLGSRTVATLGLRFPFLRYLGLAPWGSGAEMFFENGRLCKLRYTVGVETNAPGKIRNRFNISTEESFPGRNEYSFSGGGPAMFRAERIALPSDTTPRERARAFAYDLSCLTSAGGCRTLCQVLPLKPVWEDILARRPNQGMSIPADVLDDPLCNGR